jgi:DNA mismatch repair protein MutS2
LLELEAEARESVAAAVPPLSEASAPEPEAPAEPVDWRFARAGDAVALREGTSATLLALPDRRGRVAVRVGSARVLVPAERVVALRTNARPAAPRVAFEPSGGSARGDVVSGGTHRCDLRGLRVDEAQERLVAEIDRALAGGHARLEIVHGVGTGALRRAVREQLAASPFVSNVADAPPEEGGDGVTLVEL